MFFLNNIFFLLSRKLTYLGTNKKIKIAIYNKKITWYNFYLGISFII
jgi:hypothetical protein